ncbi:hypothetical protein A0256_23725 [Mucilaginibacter sp. PAMC 26640]|nr:hypothetical protein A0256_23725 [Mucilaginibacter sp. PAMC 26640]
MCGIYKFEEQSISIEPEAFPQKETAASSINIQAGGTYKAVHVPNVFQRFDSDDPDYIDAEGTWKIDTLEASWKHSKPCYGIRLSKMPEGFASMYLMGDQRPYKLIRTDDDPSLGKAIIFSKH